METFLYPVTPANLSRPLLALCEELVPGGTPQYIEAQPRANVPTKGCFQLVDGCVQTKGGASVIGWALGEQPTLFVEAELHAVWRTPTNELIDVTPRVPPTKRILFLADPSRSYTGQQVNNVRRALSKHAAVAAFLKAFDDEYEFMNRGARANQHGEIKVTGAEAQEYDEIQRRKAAHYIEMLKLHPAVEPYDPCWCGSGRKVKWCHGLRRNAV